MRASLQLSVVYWLATISSVNAQVFSPEDVRLMADEVNKSLPMQMDQDIEMMNVLPAGMTLIYNARYVNYPASYFTKDVLDAIKMESRPDGIRASCTNPRIRNLIQQGMDMKYVYYGMDGGYIWEWIVNENICSLEAGIKRSGG